MLGYIQRQQNKFHNKVFHQGVTRCQVNCAAFLALDDVVLVCPFSTPPHAKPQPQGWGFCRLVSGHLVAAS
jgi:hypothetical protein